MKLNNNDNQINFNKDLLEQYYLELLKELREKEKNFIQFLGIILPGVAVFVYGIDKYLSTQIKTYLIFSALISIFIFFCGIIFSLGISYSYRSLQLIMSGLEKELGLDKIIPDEWNYLKKENTSKCKLFDFAPTIYKLFILISLFAMLAIYIIVLCFEVNINKEWFLKLVREPIFIILTIIMFSTIMISCTLHNRYQNKLREIKKNYKEKLGIDKDQNYNKK